MARPRQYYKKQVVNLVHIPLVYFIQRDYSAVLRGTFSSQSLESVSNFKYPAGLVGPAPSNNFKDPPVNETTESNMVTRTDTLNLATDIVSAFVSNNPVPADQLQDLIQATFATLNGLGQPSEAGPTNQKPAVPVKKSVTDDYIICLEDGKKLKMLKRYLRTQYDMSPEDYRRKWNLPADYPMVAPNYAKRRSEFAKKIGLGTTGGRKATKRGRKKSS